MKTISRHEVLKKFHASMPQLPRHGPGSNLAALAGALRPVVIEGLTEAWPARTLWTNAFFKRQYGHLMVSAARQHRAKMRDFTLRGYLNYMTACREPDPYYLANCTIHHRERTLRGHYQVPEPFVHWPTCLPKPQRNLFTPWSWLYLGPRASGSFMHIDVDWSSAWNAVLTGVKLWIFYPPSQKKFLYAHRSVGLVDAFLPDFTRYPDFRDAEPYGYCLQKPGEIVFTPSGWWHQVVNLEASISITENFINGTNFEFATKHMRAEGHHRLAQMYEVLSAAFI